MMTLKEPKRKRRVRLRPCKPFPIDIGSDNEWTRYTGYLGNLGVCVIEPCEIEALHSSGFFGKGSLSRSFPNFEKTRGKPPTIRHRQLARRQEWLEQANKLETEDSAGDFQSDQWKNVGKLDLEENENSGKEICDQRGEFLSVVKDRDIKTNVDVIENDEIVEKSVVQELIVSIVSIVERLVTPTLKANKQLEKEVLGISLPQSQNVDEKLELVPARVDEVVLDSSGEEDDEICEIPNTETIQSMIENVSGDTDIIPLNDEEMPVDLDKENDSETEYKEKNSKDFIEIEQRQLLVLPDSDSDVENYLINIKPTIKKEGFPVRETMYLTFEEAFFLMFGLGCLQIVDLDGNLLNILDAWKYFCHTRNDFVQKYVAYHYFRSKGWVVKPGLKYGGDFLLYKQGPPFYHASYIVIVEVLDADTLIRNEKKTGRKMTWKKLFGLDRLSETAAKEILFAQVLWPSKIPLTEIPSTPELLADFTVRELLYRRWIPKQTREEIDLENDDDDHDYHHHHRHNK